LELGLGFHPDFTGRQNVYTAGQLLGLQPDEIDVLMPEIAAFAEIGHYLDEPVRVYSSGMQMRLAFSVATAQRPDVLIVDEALSVGDAHFQHKSFDRIRQFRDQGSTILLVSHDKAVIQSICDRVLLLHQGRVAMQGVPEVVMNYYNALLADLDAGQIEQNRLDDGRIQTVSGNQRVHLRHLTLRNTDDQPLEVVQVGQRLCLVAEVEVQQPVDKLVFGYLIKDRLGQAVFGTNTQHLGQTLHQLRAGESVTYRFDFIANLGTGAYSISTAQVGGEDHIGANYEWRDLALLFSVVNASHAHFEGVTWLPPLLSTVRE
jgi:lipopolysaccharide transport system ATP-binding protein